MAASCIVLVFIFSYQNSGLNRAYAIKQNGVYDRKSLGQTRSSLFLNARSQHQPAHASGVEPLTGPANTREDF